MIAYVKGILTEKNPAHVILEAAGVGYELLIPLSTYDKLPREGAEVKLLAFHSVHEDDETLFGFASVEERDLFGQLCTVNGVGPRIALSILSGASIGELSMAIASSDAKRLSAIKGVGKKTAEKICIELKDKVNPFAAGANHTKPEAAAGMADALSALRALGFNEETSSKMVVEVLSKHPDLEDTEKIIRLALSSR